MKRVYFKKTAVLFMLAAFIVGSWPVTASAVPSASVLSYCTRSTEPLLAINAAGTEDCTVNGVNYKRQDSVSNFSVEIKEPEIYTAIPGTQVNAFSKVEAETCIDNNGITIESCQDAGGGQNLAYIGNGDYAGYDYIYFPKGTKGFQARVSSDTDGGFIEVRLDHPGGDLIGKCRVNRTGGWQTYSDVFCELTENVEGLHKLYLYFTGEMDNGICNVNWFKFTRGAFDPISTESYDEKNGDYYLYKSLDFGKADGPVRFRAKLLGGAAGTVDLRVDSPTGTSIGTFNTDGVPDALGCLQCNIAGKVTGVHDLYLTDDSNGNILSGMKWFAFDPAEEPMPALEDGLGKLVNTNVKGYNLELSIPADKNSVYEIYLYTADLQKENKQVYDVILNGANVDTVDSEKSGLRWERKGPYLGKVLDDGKLVIQCKSKRGMAAVSGIQINKVKYSKAFKDVKIKDWFYIQVMELASKGVIFGKGNDQFSPSEQIIGEHVAYMMFNVMKQSISEEDRSFKPEEYSKISDVSPGFWAYQYMRAYYNYFFKEKMLMYDVNTRIPYSKKEYEANKKVRREEFAMAVIGARRLDYSQDGRVFVLDPEREPGSRLNLYKDKDADKVTDSFKYFIELALEKGLMKGDQNGYLNPEDPVTRAEAASFIYNALNLKENNYIKPADGESIPVPRITAKKRNVNVGILTLPAPAWDSINNKNVNDSNPDFSILELLDRNINKPMDWTLVNPYPPAFDKSEYADIMKYNTSKISGINNQSYTDFCNYFKDLKSVAEAQTDLEADITDTGVVGYTENIDKSKFCKYWEVSLDDPGLTPEKVAKSYDILFQTSHGKITYSADVQDKVKAFLNAGGQLWWENCLGLEIKAGDGFTDEVGFVSIRPGNNYKYAQVPVLDGEGNMHPLFDNIYRIDPEKASRIAPPGLSNKNSEISMLGDGEEWLNDDNRYISGLLPTDQVILNIQEPDGGKLYPNMAVRNVENTGGPAGRIVITTNDIGCGISKHVARAGGKAVEDYKFCYNLFGWMSKVAVNFDETNENTWEGKDEFTLKATVTNNGAKPQTYDLAKQFDSSQWDLLDTHDFDNYTGGAPWILALDSKGYPGKVRLEPNQSEDITFKLKIKKPDALRYNFTLKASESGALKTRDVDEYTYTLNNIRIKSPEFSMNYTGSNSNAKRFNVVIGTDDLKLNDTRPITYEVTLKIKKGSSFVDPETLLSKADIDNNGNLPAFENIGFDYSFGANNASFIKITINNAKFNSLDQKLKMVVTLGKTVSNSSYEVIGSVQAYDPITRQRLAFSGEVAFTLK